MTKVGHRARFWLPLWAALAVCAPGVVYAQTTAPAGPEEPAEFSQQELEAFAAASAEVERLNDKWRPRMSNAGNAAEEQDIRQQAMAEMGEAVRDKGLSVQRYNEIYVTAENNPVFARMIEDLRKDVN